MGNDKDLYFVAVKAFLENAAGQFLITKDRFGDWDIPGGRLRRDDFDVALEDVLKRKLTEELGSDVRYSLKQPAVFMRHERMELLSSGEREPRRIFAIGYQALFEGGEIVLGGNHEHYEWVDPRIVIPEQYFSGGWLRGVQEYIEKKRKRTI